MLKVIKAHANWTRWEGFDEVGREVVAEGMGRRAKGNMMEVESNFLERVCVCVGEGGGRGGVLLRTWRMGFGVVKEVEVVTGSYQAGDELWACMLQF